MDKLQNDTHISGTADWKRRNSLLFKIVAVILIAAFIVYDITWAQNGVPIWQQAKAAIPQGSPKNIVNGISIPSGMAEVEEMYSNGGDKVIINIQDAHDSLSAQESILKTLDSLVTNYDINLIAVEGSEGYIDPSIFRAFPNEDIKRERVESLMREGKMSAGEFFAVVSDKPIALYGIDDNELYWRNVELFKSILKDTITCKRHLKALGKTLNKLSRKVYNKESRELVIKSFRHKRGKLSFSEYWQTLSRLAKANNIDIKGRENISKFLNASELEKKINFAKANNERKALIDELSEKVSKKKLEKLVLKSFYFKKGEISQGEFHQYLIGLAQEENIKPQPYSNLINFTGYISIYESIDMAVICSEMESLENILKERVFTTEDERTLYDLQNKTRILRNLFNVKLTHKDASYLLQHRDEFQAKGFKEFINRNSRNYELPIERDYDLKYIMAKMDEAIIFYTTVQERNDAMLKNTILRMGQEKQNVAALITGGFHSKGLTGLMKEKGLSYLVVMPRFEKAKKRPYIAIFTNKKGPYEELINKGEYELAVYQLLSTGDVKEYLYNVAIMLMDIDDADLERTKAIYSSNYRSGYESTQELRRKSMATGRFSPADFDDILERFTSQALVTLRDRRDHDEFTRDSVLTAIKYDGPTELAPEGGDLLPSPDKGAKRIEIAGLKRAKFYSALTAALLNIVVYFTYDLMQHYVTSFFIRECLFLYLSMLVITYFVVLAFLSWRTERYISRKLAQLEKTLGKTPGPIAYCDQDRGIILYLKSDGTYTDQEGQSLIASFPFFVRYLIRLHERSHLYLERGLLRGILSSEFMAYAFPVFGLFKYPSVDLGRVVVYGEHNMSYEEPKRLSQMHHINRVRLNKIIGAVYKEVHALTKQDETAESAPVEINIVVDPPYPGKPLVWYEPYRVTPYGTQEHCIHIQKWFFTMTTFAFNRVYRNLLRDNTPDSIFTHIKYHFSLEREMCNFITTKSPDRVLWVSDIQNTFTDGYYEVKDNVLESIVRFLGLKIGNHFAAISGASYDSCRRQFLDPLVKFLLERDQLYLLENVTLAASNGTEIYRYDFNTGDFGLIYKVNVTRELGRDSRDGSVDMEKGSARYKKTLKIVNDCLRECNIRDKIQEVMGWSKARVDALTAEDFIEERGAQISLYVLGKEVSPEDKLTFKARGSKEVRQVWADYINSRLQEEVKREKRQDPEAEIPQFIAGVYGSSAVELLLPGVDKAYGAREICRNLGFFENQIIYTGDDFTGNDAPMLRTGCLNINVGKDQEGVEVINSPIKNVEGFKVALDTCSREFYSLRMEMQRNSYYPKKDPREEFFINSLSLVNPKETVIAVSLRETSDVREIERVRDALMNLLGQGCRIAIIGNNNELVDLIANSYINRDTLFAPRIKGTDTYVLFDSQQVSPTETEAEFGIFLTDSSTPISDLESPDVWVLGEVKEKFTFFAGTPFYGLDPRMMVLKQEGIDGVEDALQLIDASFSSSGQDVPSSVERRSLTIDRLEYYAASESVKLAREIRDIDPDKCERENFLQPEAVVRPISPSDFVEMADLANIVGTRVQCPPYAEAIGAGGISSRSGNIVLADFRFAIPGIDSIARSFLEWKAYVFLHERARGEKDRDERGGLEALLVMYSYFGRAKIEEILWHNQRFGLDRAELHTMEQGSNVHLSPSAAFLDKYLGNSLVAQAEGEQLFGADDYRLQALDRGIRYQKFSKSQLLRRPNGSFIFNPAGHWDFIRHLILSGQIDRLLAGGIRYVCFSNMNNAAYVPNDNLVNLLDTRREKAIARGETPPVFLEEFVDYEGERGTVVVKVRDRDGERIQIVKDKILEARGIPRDSFRHFHTGNFVFSLEGLAEGLLMTTSPVQMTGVSSEARREWVQGAISELSFEERQRRLGERQPPLHVSIKETHCTNFEGDPMILIGLQLERNLEDLSMILPGVYVRVEGRLVAFKNLEHFADEGKLTAAAETLRPSFSFQKHFFTHHADVRTFVEENPFTHQLIVIKDATGPGKEGLRKECEWLETIGRETDLHDAFPRVLDPAKYETQEGRLVFTMEYLEGAQTFTERLLLGSIDELEADHLATEVADFDMDEIAAERTRRAAPPNHFQKTQLDRVRGRLKRVTGEVEEGARVEAPRLQELIGQEYLTINGKRFLNALPALRLIEADNGMREKLDPKDLFRLFGDLHLDNVMAMPEGSRRKRGFALVDPKGVDAEDPVYDLAKMLHSIIGRYDFLNNDKFFVDITRGRRGMNINLSFDEASMRIVAYHRLIPAARKMLLHYALSEKCEDDPNWIYRLAFAHAAHFLSMPPLHIHTPGNDFEAVAMYCTGVVLLNIFLDMMTSGSKKYFGFDAEEVKDKSTTLRALREMVTTQLEEPDTEGHRRLTVLLQNAAVDPVKKFAVMDVLEDALYSSNEASRHTASLCLGNFIGFDLHTLLRSDAGSESATQFYRSTYNNREHQRLMRLMLLSTLKFHHEETDKVHINAKRIMTAIGDDFYLDNSVEWLDGEHKDVDVSTFYQAPGAEPEVVAEDERERTEGYLRVLTRFLAHRDVEDVNSETLQATLGTEKADLLMLHGCSVIEIVETAAEIYSQDLANKIIVTGGHGRQTQQLIDNLAPAGYGDIDLTPRFGQEISEAEIFREILVRNGVPRGAIMVEAASTNMREHVRNSMNILRSHGYGPHNLHTVINMQHPLFQMRADVTFDRTVSNITSRDEGWDIKRVGYAAFIPDISTMGTQTRAHYIDLMLGELYRLRKYFPRIMEQMKIPEDAIREAFSIHGEAVLEAEKKLQRVNANLASQWDGDFANLYAKSQEMSSGTGLTPEALDGLMAEYDAYLGGLIRQRRASARYHMRSNERIAYFSMEYGIGPLRTYAGDLGISAGDHLRALSDRYSRDTVVAVGLAWHSGYFQQEISQEKEQVRLYPEVPIEEYTEVVKDEAGGDLVIRIEAPDRRYIYAKVRKAMVGRVELYLLDTAIPENKNNPDALDGSYNLTDELYPGAAGTELRFQQEYLLGIGGIHLLEKIGLRPAALHLNGDHTAFAAIDLMRSYLDERAGFVGLTVDEDKDEEAQMRRMQPVIGTVERGITYNDGKEAVQLRTGFTSYATLPQDNEEYPEQLFFKYFKSYCRSHALDFDDLCRMCVGQSMVPKRGRVVNLAELAIGLSHHVDPEEMEKPLEKRSVVTRAGVNRKQAVILQRIHSDDSFGVINNAVHRPFWQADIIKQLLERRLAEMQSGGQLPRMPLDMLSREQFSILMSHIRDDEIIGARNIMKAQAVARLKRVHDERRREALSETESVVEPKEEPSGSDAVDVQHTAFAEEHIGLINGSPDTFTIVLANRFTWDKRVELMLDDSTIDTLVREAKKRGLKLQIIFAGKTHPENTEGENTIRRIHEVANKWREVVFFIPDYDIEIEKCLSQIASVWQDNTSEDCDAATRNGLYGAVNGIPGVATGFGWTLDADKKGSVFLFSTLDDLLSLYAGSARDLDTDYEKGIMDMYRNDQLWARRMKRTLFDYMYKFNMTRIMRKFEGQMLRPLVSNGKTEDLEFYAQLRSGSHGVGSDEDGFDDTQQIEIAGLKYTVILSAITAFMTTILSCVLHDMSTLSIIAGFIAGYTALNTLVSLILRRYIVKALGERAGPIAETITRQDGTKYIFTAPEFDHLHPIIQYLVLLHERTHLAGLGEFFAYAMPWIGLFKKVDLRADKQVKRELASIGIARVEYTKDNMLKILNTENPAQTLQILRTQGLLARFIPSLAALDGVFQGYKYHFEGDALQHTMLVFNHLPGNLSADETIRLKLAALFHDIAKGMKILQTVDKEGHVGFKGNYGRNHAHYSADMTGPILRELGFSEDIVEDVVWLVDNHVIFGRLNRETTEGKEALFSNKNYPLLLELNRMDMSTGMNKEVDRKALEENKMAEYDFRLNTLSSFLAQRDDLPDKADIIVAFGGEYLETAFETARLYLEGKADTVIFVGGVGHSTADLRDKASQYLDRGREEFESLSESEILYLVFKDELKKAGLRNHEIEGINVHFETRSRNCQENVEYMRDLIKGLSAGEGLRTDKIILVEQPPLQRRIGLTFEKWFKTDFPHSQCFNHAAFIPGAGLLRNREYAATMVEEVEKLEIYARPQCGYIAPLAIEGTQPGLLPPYIKHTLYRFKQMLYPEQFLEANGTLVAGHLRIGDKARTDINLPIQVESGRYREGSSFSHFATERYQTVFHLKTGSVIARVDSRRILLKPGDIISIFTDSELEFIEDSEYVVFRQTDASDTQADRREQINGEVEVFSGRFVKKNNRRVAQVYRDQEGNLLATVHRADMYSPPQMTMVTPVSSAIGVGVKIANGEEAAHRHERRGKSRMEISVCRGGSFSAEIADKEGNGARRVDVKEGEALLLYPDSVHGFAFDNTKLAIVMQDPAWGVTTSDKVIIEDEGEQVQKIEIKGLSRTSLWTVVLAIITGVGTYILRDVTGLPIVLGFIAGYSTLIMIISLVLRMYIADALGEGAGPIAETITPLNKPKYILTYPEFDNLSPIIQYLVLLHERTHLAGLGEFFAYALPWIGLFKRPVVRRADLVDILLREYKAAYPDVVLATHVEPDRGYIISGINAMFSGEEVDDVLEAIRRASPAVRAESIEKIIRGFENYSYTATGTHRFVPLALTLVNQLRGRDLFDRRTADELIQAGDEFKYLSETYPFYANPFGVDEDKIPEYLPSLTLPRPETKRVYRWLDIGSAPDNDGAATLNLIRNTFRQFLAEEGEVEISGTDMFFPLYELQDDGSIVESTKFQFDGNGKSIEPVNDVNYYDAKLARNDATSDEFDLGEFDYISLCATLHHLARPDEEISRMPLADVNLVNENGYQFTENYWLSPTQQKAITNLSNSLSMNGILFLNLTQKYFAKPEDISDEEWRQRLQDESDLFVIIQRTEDDKFTVYNVAVPFRPGERTFNSEEYLMQSRRDIIWRHPGIAGRYSRLPPAFYLEVGRLLHWADLLVYRFQKRGRSVWGRVSDAARVLKRKGTLTEMFEAYLTDVPYGYKEELLGEVRAIDTRSDEPQHAFRPLSWWSPIFLGGGIDWVVLFGGLTGFFLYGLLTPVSILASFEATQLMVFGAITLMFFITSLVRVKESLKAIKEAHPEFNWWQRWTHNIGGDEAALARLRENAYYTYIETAFHESFTWHLLGLLAFVPGVGRIRDFITEGSDDTVSEGSPSRIRVGRRSFIGIVTFARKVMRAATVVAQEAAQLPANINTNDTNYNNRLQEAVRVGGYATNRVYSDRNEDSQRDALIMLLTTGEHESDRFRQRVGGRDLDDRGITQVNRNTASDLMRYLTGPRTERNGNALALTIVDILNLARNLTFTTADLTTRTATQLGRDLVHSDAFSFAMTGVQYRMDRNPLPDGSAYATIPEYAEALGDYWFRVYNRSGVEARRRQMVAAATRLLNNLAAQGYVVVGNNRNWRVTRNGIELIQQEARAITTTEETREVTEEVQLRQPFYRNPALWIAGIGGIGMGALVLLIKRRSRRQEGHAYRPLSWWSLIGLGGGIDWIGIFGGLTGYIAYSLLTAWSTMDAFQVGRLIVYGIITLMLFISSFLRVKNTLKAIKEAHPEFNLWQRWTRNIGADGLARAKLKNISYGTYLQVIIHEFFIVHVHGLLAFLPGASYIMYFFGRKAYNKKAPDFEKKTMVKTLVVGAIIWGLIFAACIALSIHLYGFENAFFNSTGYLYIDGNKTLLERFFDMYSTRFFWRMVGMELFLFSVGILFIIFIANAIESARYEWHEGQSEDGRRYVTYSLPSRSGVRNTNDWDELIKTFFPENTPLLTDLLKDRIDQTAVPTDLSEVDAALRSQGRINHLIIGDQKSGDSPSDFSRLADDDEELGLKVIVVNPEGEETEVEREEPADVKPYNKWASLYIFVQSDMEAVKQREKMDVITCNEKFQSVENAVEELVSLYNDLEKDGMLLVGYEVPEDKREHLLIFSEALARLRDLGATVEYKETRIMEERAYYLAVSIVKNDEEDVIVEALLSEEGYELTPVPVAPADIVIGVVGISKVEERRINKRIADGEIRIGGTRIIALNGDTEKANLDRLSREVEASGAHLSALLEEYNSDTFEDDMVEVVRTMEREDRLRFVAEAQYGPIATGTRAQICETLQDIVSRLDVIRSAEDRLYSLSYENRIQTEDFSSRFTVMNAKTEKTALKVASFRVHNLAELQWITNEHAKALMKYGDNYPVKLHLRIADDNITEENIDRILGLMRIEDRILSRDNIVFEDRDSVSGIYKLVQEKYKGIKPEDVAIGDVRDEIPQSLNTDEKGRALLDKGLIFVKMERGMISQLYPVVQTLIATMNCEQAQRALDGVARLNKQPLGYIIFEPVKPIDADTLQTEVDRYEKLLTAA